MLQHALGSFFQAFGLAGPLLPCQQGSRPLQCFSIGFSIIADGLFIDVQRLLIEILRLLQSILLLIECGQILDLICRMVIFRSLSLLSNGNRLLKKRLGL